jgi:hypothetical protein
MKKHYKGLYFLRICGQQLRPSQSPSTTIIWGKIEEKSPDALEWLDDNHSYIWSRSNFS